MRCHLPFAFEILAINFSSKDCCKLLLKFWQRLQEHCRCKMPLKFWQSFHQQRLLQVAGEMRCHHQHCHRGQYQDPTCPIVVMAAGPTIARSLAAPVKMIRATLLDADSPRPTRARIARGAAASRSAPRRLLHPSKGIQPKFATTRRHLHSRHGTDSSHSNA